MWGNWSHPGYMGYDGGWFWGWGLHGLFSLIFFALIIVAGVLLIRWLWRASGQAGPAREAGRGSALETLELRYARGEIEREEYLQKRQDLTS